MKLLISISIIALLLTGCGSTGHRAPVVGSDGEQGDWRPNVYVVKKGDTLYNIAFNYGLSYRRLAELNDIDDPDKIFVGQEIRLFQQARDSKRLVHRRPGSDRTATVVAPRADNQSVERNSEAGSGADSQPKIQVLSRPDVKVVDTSRASTDSPEKAGSESPSQVKKASADAATAAEKAADRKPVAKSGWQVPVKGQIVARFSNTENRKGIHIAGEKGQAVLAMDAGSVVYSGSGLRGYGKLVIIKHDDIYLSAYAHNDKVLVKEDETVTRGQKIAEMGDTDSDQVKLHFEIRRYGKPVDPLRYIPAELFE